MEQTSSCPTEVSFRLAGESKARKEPATFHLAHYKFEQAMPAREFQSWPHKRNYEGSWWSSTTRTHLRFESFLERDALIRLDFDPTVIGIASQPFELFWPGDAHNCHVPDFFARRLNREGLVLDVKTSALLTPNASAQLDDTRVVCRAIGWEYEVFAGLPVATAGSLRWLAAYRVDRHVPSSDLRIAILGAFNEPRELEEAVLLIERDGPFARPRIITSVYNLLWTGILHTNLGTPLSLHTVIRI